MRIPGQVLSLLLLFGIIGPLSAQSDRVESFYSNVIKISKESIGMTVVPPVEGVKFTSDCIGFVRYVYYRAGLDLLTAYGNGRGGVSSLYDGLEKYGFIYDTRDPRPGDIVFFDNTYDVNRDGRWNDPLSHIGIITKIGKHNTAFYIHFATGGVNEERMNLHYPNTHAFRQSDKSLYIINSFLRRQRGEGFEKKEYVASSFYRAFAHIKIKPRS